MSFFFGISITLLKNYGAGQDDAQYMALLINTAYEAWSCNNMWALQDLATISVLTLVIVPFWDYCSSVRIIALSTLKAFWENNKDCRDAREPILAWYRHVLHADWSTPADVKRDFRNASILWDGRVVFNIAANKYRLVVWINYAYHVVYVRFIGTHAQYDAIDAQTI